jgi:hypothetical protein
MTNQKRQNKSRSIRQQKRAARRSSKPHSTRGEQAAYRAKVKSYGRLGAASEARHICPTCMDSYNGEVCERCGHDRAAKWRMLPKLMWRAPVIRELSDITSGRHRRLLAQQADRIIGHKPKHGGRPI